MLGTKMSFCLENLGSRVNKITQANFFLCVSRFCPTVEMSSPTMPNLTKVNLYYNLKTLLLLFYQNNQNVMTSYTAAILCFGGISC